MALSATFQADFTSFTDAVAKAEVSLKSFEQGAGKVESSLTRMTNSLSGTKVIQDAALMAEAVERVGGVSKLTENELAKVSRTASEAAEKLKALGQDVPAGIQKLADASKSTSTAVSDMGGKFDLSWAAVSRFAGALGIGLGISQLVSFGKSVFDSASNISDLSSKLGTSTDFVQRMSFAASQTGTTIEAVGNAIATMNVALSKGDDSTIAALSNARLSFDSIKTMRPEDAFLAIAGAIKEIPNPMLQAEVAVRLFGKSGQELLPAIKQGIKDIGDSASVMSADTVRSLDEAGDAWDKFKTRISNIGGTVFAPVVEALDRMLDMGERFMHLDAYGVTLSFLGLRDALDDVKRSGDQAFGSIANGIQLATPPLQALKTEMRDAFDVLKEFDASNRDSEVQIRQNISAYEAYTAAVHALSQQWTGARLDERVKQFSDALAESGGVSKITAFEMAGVVKQLDEFIKQGAVLTPTLAALWFTQKDFNVALDTTGASLRRVIDAGDIYKNTLIKVPPVLTDIVFKSEAVADATDKMRVKADGFAESANRASSAITAMYEVASGGLARDRFNSADGNRSAAQIYDDSVQNSGYGGMFSIPDTSKYFTPRVGQFSRGGGITVNQNVNVPVYGTPEAMARATSDALAQSFNQLGFG